MSEVNIVSKPTNRQYRYQLLIKDTYSDRVQQYVENELFAELCRCGCKNYANKWCCPPISPSYPVVSAEYRYLTIFVLYMQMDQFSHVKNDYTKIKAANTMMKSRIDRFLRSKIIAGNDNKMISTGSCRLCRPCKMSEGNPCRHPGLMAYSFEALGVNVNAMTENICNHKLLWYSKGHLPLYTTVVAGLLTNDQTNVDKLAYELQVQDM